MNREELKKLLIICTQKSHFQFNGDYYEQIDGVAMGSPLGPLFASFFMSSFERKHMPVLKTMGIIKWLRYVDDIFATMSEKGAAEQALNYLNAQHPNIKFTIEHEEKNKLPFLDTLVGRHKDRYTTSVYHKSTYTGLYLNWTSLTARRYKIGLIKCLANRIWNICSDPKERETELIKLRFTLLQNEYPPDIVDQELKAFKERKMKPSSLPPKPDKKRFIVLPYTNRKCEEFAFRLKNLVDSNFNDLDFNVAFKTPRTIGHLFPYKDRIQHNEEKSMLVYKITCKNCESTYIGKTARILSHRINEHKLGSSSACRQHIQTNPDHCMDYENIEIIDTADNDLKLRIKELLHILKKKPSLNKQLNSQSDFDIKTLIIQAYSQFRNK